MLLKEMERERETQLTGQIIYKLKVKGWNQPSQQIPTAGRAGKADSKQNLTRRISQDK